MPVIIIVVGLLIYYCPIGNGYVDTHEKDRAEQVKVIMEQK